MDEEERPLAGGLTVGIVGSRTFSDRDLVHQSVERLIDRYDWVWVCSGASPGGGADILAREVCRELGAHMCPEPPAGGVLGCYMSGGFHFYEHVPKARNRSAYLERNSLIAHDANMLIAFYADGPRSPGTTDTVTKALRKPIPVHIYHEGHWTTLPTPKGNAHDRRR